MKAALHIFPRFAGLERIERVRARFDPLYGLIPPHITLVFPFEADERAVAEAMAAARRALSNERAFDLQMGPVWRRGNYLMLLPERGEEDIRRLHDELYDGAFAAWYAPEYGYAPHVTLGRGAMLPDGLDLGRSFCCVVDEVALECIEPDGQSKIMDKIPLKREGGIGR